MLERADGEEVDVDPDGAAPVWRVVLGVAGVVEAGGGGEGAEAEGGEEAGGVGDGLEEVAELRGVGGDDLEQEGEETCGRERKKKALRF